MEHFVRSYFSIPQTLFLSKEDIEKLYNIIIKARDFEHAMIWITLDCSTFCQGCYFCDEGIKKYYRNRKYR